MAPYYCNRYAKRNSHPEKDLQVAVIEGLTRILGLRGRAREKGPYPRNMVPFFVFLFYLLVRQTDDLRTVCRAQLRYFVIFGRSAALFLFSGETS